MFEGFLSHTENKFSSGIMFLAPPVRAHNFKTTYQNLFKFYRGVSGNSGIDPCNCEDVSIKNGLLVAIFVVLIFYQSFCLGS